MIFQCQCHGKGHYIFFVSCNMSFVSICVSGKTKLNFAGVPGWMKKSPPETENLPYLNFVSNQYLGRKRKIVLLEKSYLQNSILNKYILASNKVVSYIYFFSKASNKYLINPLNSFSLQVKMILFHKMRVEKQEHGD